MTIKHALGIFVLLLIFIFVLLNLFVPKKTRVIQEMLPPCKGIINELLKNIPILKEYEFCSQLKFQ